MLFSKNTRARGGGVHPPKLQNAGEGEDLPGKGETRLGGPP